MMITHSEIVENSNEPSQSVAQLINTCPGFCTWVSSCADECNPKVLPQHFSNSAQLAHSVQDLTCCPHVPLEELSHRSH